MLISRRRSIRQRDAQLSPGWASQEPDDAVMVEEHRTSRFLRTLTYFQAVKDLNHALLASASIERTCSSGRDIGIGSIVAFGQLGMPDAGAVLELDVSRITGDTLFSRYPPCCG
jgi:hypothetical protein